MSQGDFKLLMLPPSSDLLVLGSQAWTTMPTSMRKGGCRSPLWVSFLVCSSYLCPVFFFFFFFVLCNRHKTQRQACESLLASLFLFFPYEAFLKEVLKRKTPWMWAASLRVAVPGCTERRKQTGYQPSSSLGPGSEHRVSSCFMLQVSSLPRWACALLNC